MGGRIRGGSWEGVYVYKKVISYVFSLISLYSKIYSVMSLLPLSSGAFQNNVMESSVTSTGSGDPGFDGGSKK